MIVSTTIDHDQLIPSSWMNSRIQKKKSLRGERISESHVHASTLYSSPVGQRPGPRERR